MPFTKDAEGIDEGSYSIITSVHNIGERRIALGQQADGGAARVREFPLKHATTPSAFAKSDGDGAKGGGQSH